jgi:hypothetical protein
MDVSFKEQWRRARTGASRSRDASSGWAERARSRHWFVGCRNRYLPPLYNGLSGRDRVRAES